MCIVSWPGKRLIFLLLWIVVLIMSLTDCRYFIPSFTELTTSDITENKHLLAENGISYPIGTFIDLMILEVDQASEQCVFSLYKSVLLLFRDRNIDCAVFATVCKPSLAHCNGQSIPLQADREEVEAWNAVILSLCRSLSISISVGHVLPYAKYHFILKHFKNKTY